MLFGPVFTAEMITSGRRARNVWLRVVYGFVLLFALVTIYSSYWQGFQWQLSTVQRYAMLAEAFFATFSVLQLLGVVLIVPAITAGTIASERERRTIEHLFASDLSNWEIVFGKLMASLVRAVSFLLVGPPILALAMWLGGVGPDRLLAVLIATLSTLLAVTSLALSVSVWSPRARQAISRCYFYLAVLLLIPPLIYGASFVGATTYPQWLQTVLKPVFRMSEEFLQANPFYVVPNILIAMRSTGGADPWSILWPLVRDQAVVTIVCMVVATLAVRRVHLKTLSAGVKRQRRIVPRRAVGNRPMLWKELHADPAQAGLGLVGRLLLTLVSIAIAGLSIWEYLQALESYDPSEYFRGYSSVLGTMIGCLVVLFVGGRAASSIAGEKERDTWTTLIGTPLEAGEIVFAKWAASLLSARWVLLALALLWLLAVTLDWYSAPAMALLLLSLAVVTMFAAGLGIWFSLWCANSTRALCATMAILIVLGGAYLPLGTCGCGWLFFTRSSRDLAMLALAPCIPFLLAIPNFVPDYLRSTRNHDHVDLSIAIAFGLGMVGYAAAALVVYQSAVARFDRLAGRTWMTPSRASNHWERRPPAARPEEPVTAIMLDDTMHDRRA
jgi:ABC-type transport system involved in multi-copper enzyme maturation permease subunit